MLPGFSSLFSSRFCFAVALLQQIHVALLFLSQNWEGIYYFKLKENLE